MMTTTPDGKVVRLGDIIAYHNETTVDWFGTFLQGQYDTEKFNLYGMGGISTIAYTYQDHFSVEKEVVGLTLLQPFKLKVVVDIILTIDYQHLLISDMFKNHQS